MLAFMMPLGAALNSTGAGEMIANAVISANRRFWRYDYYGIIVDTYMGFDSSYGNTAACTLLCR